MSRKSLQETPSPGFFRWLYRTVDNWFFGHGSPVTIGVFRAIMCGLIFVNLVMILVSFHDWFSQNGYVPTSLDARYFDTFTDLYGIAIPRINLFGLDPGPEASALIYGGTMLFAALSMLGLWTRFSTICMAIGLVSIHHRNGFILHGGDTLMRVSALYIAIAPSGAAFSLDRLFGVRAKRLLPIPTSVSLWPQRLIEVQVAVLYFTSTWHKWTGHHWRQGEAVWYPLNLNEFDRFPVPGFAYSKPMVMVATYATLIVQLSFATLVFYRPLRKWVLLAGLGMHLSIDYAMNIPLFSFLMIATYVCFYEGDEVVNWWDQIRARWMNRRRTKGDAQL